MRSAAAPALGTMLAAVLLAGGAAPPPARAADLPPPPSLPPAAPGKVVAVQMAAVRFFAATAPPAGWMTPAFDDNGWGGPALGPFAPRAPVGTPPGAFPANMPYDLPPGGTLFLRRRFDVAAPAAARVLELRVPYADGFVAYLNGREIARRGLPSGPLADGARPSLPHGPEVESVYIPVGPATTGPLLPTGNRVAVEIRASGAAAAIPLVARAPAGDVAVTAAAGIRIVRGPYLVAPRETAGGAAVSVAWETDLPGTGRVVVEPADGVPGAATTPRTFAAGSPALRQVVAVSGLARGHRYRYRLEVVAESDAEDRDQRGPFVFATAPDRAKTFRFAVYGDMRAPGHEAHRQVAARLAAEAPVVIFNTGDLVGEGNEESNWQRYFDITGPLGAVAPVVPALGNHDRARAGLGAAKTWGLFAMSPAGRPGWTSLDLSGVHFIILDAEQWHSAAQHDWLVGDLSRARAAHPRAIFAFLHEGPWAHGIHGGSAAVEAAFTPLLAAAGTDVLFVGHDHLYERGVGETAKGTLPYVVAGGGGAPLYDPSCRVGEGPAGAAPLPRCPASVAIVEKTYNYLIIEVGDHGVSLCARRPDGTPIEACVDYPLRHQRR
jgi:hypothetical protein